MITLIGSSLAKKCLVFTYYNESKKCEECRFKRTCLNLETGRKYQIVNVKEATHNCAIHKDGKVQTVEVEPATIRTVVSTNKSFKGATIIFKSPECSYRCENQEICNPEGLYNDDKCHIEEVGSEITCANGYKLTEVIVSR